MTELATHMTNFIFEVRKESGEEFPPKSLYTLRLDCQSTIRYATPLTLLISLPSTGYHEIAIYIDDFFLTSNMKLVI